VDRVRALESSIRCYAWGSQTLLAELQGRPSPSSEPEAELWVGAHPGAPSQVVCEEGRVPLPEWIARDPARVLGAGVASRFGGELPFLLKLLAVERPLSLQAHPDARRAREGFERESRAGLAAGDPARAYRDARHKPELVCALRRFHTLSGLREPAAAAALLAALGVPAFDDVRTALERAARGGDPAHALARLLDPSRPARRDAVASARRAAAARADADPAFGWVVRLADLHPDDPAALAPLLLRLLELAPGEALFLPPGELHCHLQGAAVEVMASSDNVVRGGLTEKPVDVGELLRVARFAPAEPAPLAPGPASDAEHEFAAPCAEFRLARLRVVGGRAARAGGGGALGLVLCTAGELRFEGSGPRLSPGVAALVPAAAAAQRLVGVGEAFRVEVPPA
jgi:mannose-6-phosphate isomerase